MSSRSSNYGPDEKLHPRLSTHRSDPSLGADAKRRFGVARAVYSFDDANRIVLEQFSGADNRPVENIYGAASVEFTYGTSGKPIEKWLSLRHTSVPVKNLEPPPT